MGYTPYADQQTIKDVSQWLLDNATTQPRPKGKKYDHLKGTGPCLKTHLTPSGAKYASITRTKIPEMGDKPWLVHRVVYCAECGELDATKEINHECDFELCINPLHLKQDTHEANMAAMKARGRHVKSGPRLTLRQREHIRSLRAKSPKRWTHKRLGEKFGVSVRAIGYTLRGN